MIRTVLLLLLLSSCSDLAPERTAARDPGGSVLLRAAEIAALERRGMEKRIAGECLSACTLYLGLSTACFEEGATLGFHGPRLVVGRPLPDAQARRLAAFMASYYPPRVAEWFMAEARFSRRMIRVPAAELVARGEARACPA